MLPLSSCSILHSLSYTSGSVVSLFQTRTCTSVVSISLLILNLQIVFAYSFLHHFQKHLYCSHFRAPCGSFIRARPKLKVLLSFSGDVATFVPGRIQFGERRSYMYKRGSTREFSCVSSLAVKRKFHEEKAS